MRLTRRGYAVLGVALGAIVLAWGAGPRALNAVAAPLLVALLAGAVQLHRADEPTVERTRPRRGFPGDDRRVTLTVTGGGVARIADRVSDGLVADATVSRTLPATVEYELHYERRGRHALGRTDVRVTDALGLVAQSHTVGDRTEVLVYPPIYAMAPGGGLERALGPITDERTAFDRIREYVPGDSLRDVHWAASAKHGDLLVVEWEDPADETALAIAAAGDDAAADGLAAAVATVYVAATRAGLAASVALPDETIAEGYGDTHRNQVLGALARTGGGEVPADAWREADVRIRATTDGVTITIAGADYALEELTVSRDNPLRAEVVA